MPRKPVLTSHSSHLLISNVEIILFESFGYKSIINKMIYSDQGHVDLKVMVQNFDLDSEHLKAFGYQS